MRGEIINAYQRLNSEDQKAFRHWLWANAVVGAVLLTGLIALALTGPSDQSGASARLLQCIRKPNFPEGQLT